jgi:uncharacterized protein YndB with AHSA1/START domain
MSHIYVESEQVINAPLEEVYDALSDYEHKRPQILPPNFVDYSVERGGVGTGTIIDYRLKAGGRERPYTMQIEESVKGRVITEQDTNSTLVTRWSLQPLKDGKQTRVSVSTEWDGGTGIGGFFERTFAPIGLRQIYNAMLSKLATSLQTEESGNTVLEEDSSSSIPMNLAIFLLLIALIFGTALGLNYLRTEHE